MTFLKAVRGTRDLLPPETELWNRVEAVTRRVFARYNFGEIRTPIFEDTSLFARGVGERPTSSRKRCTRGKIAPVRSRKSHSPSLCARKIPPAWSAPTSNTTRRDRPPPEALLHRSAIPPRAPAEGSLPAVLADWRRGHRPAERRIGVAAARCRSARDAGELSR